MPDADEVVSEVDASMRGAESEPVDQPRNVTGVAAAALASSDVVIKPAQRGAPGATRRRTAASGRASRLFCWPAALIYLWRVRWSRGGKVVASYSRSRFRSYWLSCSKRGVFRPR